MSGLKQTRPPLMAFDLPDAVAAQAMAQQIADKSGREVSVLDADGLEVCTVRPAPNQVRRISEQSL
jgi:hypothetical protein